MIHWSVILSEEAERNVQQVAGTFFFLKFLRKFLLTGVKTRAYGEASLCL